MKIRRIHPKRSLSQAALSYGLGFAVLTVLLCLQPTPVWATCVSSGTPDAESAHYATSGATDSSGANVLKPSPSDYKSQVAWLNWDNCTFPTNSTDLRNKIWTLPNGWQVKGVFRNSVNNTALVPKTASGSGTGWDTFLDNLYTSAPVGIGDNTPDKDNYTFTTTYTLYKRTAEAGIPIPADIIAADGEDTAKPENIQFQTNQNAWQILQSYSNTTSSEVANSSGTLSLTETAYSGSYSTVLALTTGNTAETVITTTLQTLGQQTAAYALLFPLDFGDAPDTYDTPSHYVRPVATNGTVSSTATSLQDQSTATLSSSPLYIGSNPPDFETAPQSTTDASGDAGDEGGVTFAFNNSDGTYTVSVPITGTGYLSAWVDLNQANGFSDVGEQIANDVSVSNGIATLTFGPVPANDTYIARFRLCSSAGDCNTFDSAATGGEVEDYQVFLTKPTLSSIERFNAVLEGSQVVLHWSTSSELGTSGFYVERLEPASGQYQRLNAEVLPALMDAPQGGLYQLADPTAVPGQSYTYRLIEQEVWGSTREYGPWTVTATASAARHMAAAETNAANDAETASLGYSDPAQGYHAQPRPLAAELRRAAQAADVPVREALAADKKAAGVVQIPVRQDGLISVSATQLAQALDANDSQIRQWLRSGKLELTTAGKPVAWQALPNDAGLLFYGQGIDSLYTRDNIYQLKADTRGLTLDESKAGKAPKAGVAETFTDTRTFEQDLFAATFVATSAESDYWRWQRLVGGADPNWNVKRVTLALPDVTQGGSLQIHLNGASSSAHRVQAFLNGQSLGEAQWSGLSDYTLQATLDSGSLRSGDNEVEIRALGGTADIVYLDRITVTYLRQARAVQDQLTLTAPRSGPLTVEGFTTGQDLHVLDITAPQRPVMLTRTTVAAAGQGYAVTFNAQANRRYLAVAKAALTAATLNPQTIALPKRDRVDYVVITSPDLQDAAQSLADYRQSKGLSSRVVTTQEIYDSVNHGLADPHAIQTFIASAIRNWKTRYVVLVGRGSFDYRNLLGAGAPQAPTLLTVTPQGLYGCDTCLADTNQDGAPEIAIGRIPANSPAEAQAYLSKLKAYESQPGSLKQAGVLLVADKSDDGGNFTQSSDAVAQVLPAGLAIQKLYAGQINPTTIRPQLIAAFNAGQIGLMTYIGHSNTTSLGRSATLLHANDTASLRSTSRLPILTALSCAVNRFDLPNNYIVLGQQLTLDTDGGAIAVWSASGLSMNQQATELGQGLAEAIFHHNAPTLGEAICHTLTGHTQQATMPAYMLRIYNLLGDPALTLH